MIAQLGFNIIAGIAVLAVLIALGIKYRRWEILVIIVTVLIWWGRILLHGFVMFFYVYPAVIEAIILSVIITVLIVKWKFEDSYDKDLIGVVIFMVSLFFLGIILGCIGNWYSNEDIARMLKVTEISQLPALDSSQLRILPKLVADKYIKDAAQYPQFSPTEAHIVIVDNAPYWVSTLSPVWITPKFGPSKGIVGVKATVTEKVSFVKEQDLQVAPGRWITEEDWYRAVSTDYFADYEYSYPVLYENNIYLVMPKITYSLRFRFPSFYTVPYWGGVLMIDSSGNITTLSPEEAIASPILKGQRIFPEGLARRYIDAYNYKYGIANVLFEHKEQFEIVDIALEEQINQQPFLIKTENSLEWLFATKPYGSEARGILKIFLLNAVDGSIKMYKLPENEPLLGPVAAADYVKRAAPLVDWSTMVCVEPIPVITENAFYWEIRIVPRRGSGITYIALVNAKDGSTSLFNTASEFISFVRGAYQPPEQVTPPQEENIRQMIEKIKLLIQQLQDELSRLENMLV